MGSFFDYTDGDFVFFGSGDMAMDANGDLMLRMGDSMAMDMETGELHIISCWPDDDD